MEKKAKIIRTVFKNAWAGPNGNVFYHEIELDNGDKGSIGCKEQMPQKLNPGNELTYTIDVSDKGNKIKAVVSHNNFIAGAKKPQQDPKIQMISFSMSYTKDLIVAGKVPMIDLAKEFNNIYNLMTSKI